MISKFLLFSFLIIQTVAATNIGQGQVIEVPNTFNTIEFEIENVVQVKTLDSTLQVSCVIHKELVFVDLISQNERIVNVFGHGMVELDKNLRHVKSRFYLFKIKNSPDQYILATTENDKIPNTILADHSTVVDGQKHMDSLLRHQDGVLFEHYENSILYEKNQIVGFEIKSLIPVNESVEEDLQSKSGYFEEIYVEPLYDLEDESDEYFYEMHAKPISFLDGKVLGYHQMINLAEGAEPYNQYYEQEYALLDADGFLIYSDQIYWDKPMQAAQALKLYQQEAIASANHHAMGACYLFNEVADAKINKYYEKKNHHLLAIDKQGNQLLSVPFEAEFQFKNPYGITASQEVEKTLISDLSLKKVGTAFKLEANFFWFNSNKLLNHAHKIIDITPTPSFKKDPIFTSEHIGSVQVNDRIRCVVYRLEETTEDDVKDNINETYHKTWYAFMTYDQQGNLINFDCTQSFIRDDEAAEIELMPNRKDQIVFTVSRPNYFINSFKQEVVGKHLTALRIDNRNGIIQKSDLQFDLFK